MLVLIIENDEETLGEMELSLNMCLPDFHMVTDNSVNNCIEIIKDKRPDLVIVDMDTVKDDGFNLLGKIKGISDTPVIILSSAKEENEEIKALEMGIVEYIKKPFRQLEFMARTRALLRRKGKAISG